MQLLPAFVATLVGIATTSPLSSQLPQKDAATGFGALRIGPLNVETPTGGNTLLGVVELGGLFYVSGRAPTGVPPHEVYVIGTQGQLVRKFDQSTAVNQFSVWGYRDGDTDGTSLAFGSELGIEIIDPVFGLPVTTFNGQPVTSPINAGFGTHRAVAFDPNGDGGAGSFWTCDFGTPLFEIDLEANVLRQWPPPSGATAWFAYGLAWDTQGTASAADDMLWVNSAPNEGDIRELNPRTGQFTGNLIRRDQATSYQGGLDAVDTLLGGNGAFGLVALDQGGPDSIGVYRVDRDSLNPGENEGLLQSGVGTGLLSIDTPKFYYSVPNQIAYGFDISRDPSLLGRPGVLILNAGFNLPNGVIPGYPELVAQVFPAVMLPVALGQPSFSFTVPSSIVLGTQVRSQVAYYEPRVRSNQFAMTNQVVVERAQIVVKSDGLDSYNSDPEGFFSITNFTSNSIAEVTLDWTTSSNPLLLAVQEFDTDQAGMGDRFDAGNSTLTGCRGTYRNNSATRTGLIFDSSNTMLGVPCAPTSNCGWIGTNPGDDPGDWRTLKFRFLAGRFAGGERFEFDCDTDRGPTGGDEMAGLVVTIRLTNGTTLGPAELTAVPGQTRAMLKF